MGHLVGLKGMRPSVKAWTASSITGAMETLKNRRVCSVAGDNGAITIWRPKGSRTIYAEFHRYIRTLSAKEFRTLAELRGWLREWWPQMD